MTSDAPDAFALVRGAVPPEHAAAPLTSLAGDPDPPPSKSGWKPPREILAAGAVLATILAWASAFPLIGIGLASLDPLPLAAARFALAAVLAGGWLLVARPKLPAKRDLVLVGLCGAVGIALYNGLLNSGQQSVSAGAASFIINTSPIMTALLAALFLRERFGAFGWIGSAVAFAGIAIIAIGQAGGLTLGAGATLVLAAAFCQASYFTMQRPLVPRYGALPCAAWTIIVGALLLSPWLGEAIGQLRASPDPVEAGWTVVALAVLPSVIGFAAWTYALGFYGAARASNFLYLVAPVAVAIAYVLTGEVPALTTLLGGALAIAGVATVNLRARRLAPAESKPPLA